MNNYCESYCIKHAILGYYTRRNNGGLRNEKNFTNNLKVAKLYESPAQAKRALKEVWDIDELYSELFIHKLEIYDKGVY